ncbi:MAG: DUF2963 domain-containing protein, partial [Candidatus Phytoplasma sp. TWB_XP]
YNPVNGKLIKEENHNDGLIKEYDKDNGDKEYYSLITPNLVKKIETEVDKLTNDNKQHHQYHEPDNIFETTTTQQQESKKQPTQQQEKQKERNYYYEDGKTIHYVELYEIRTGNYIKRTYYNKDGKKYLIADFRNGILKTQTYYNPDGTIREEKTY